MIQIERQTEQGIYRLADIFPDIKQFAVLREIFTSSEELAWVLNHTKVIVSDRPSYMKVDNDDGSIQISIRHLKDSDAIVLYLDIIHELVHVKQHRQGLDLYDRTRSYVDRQTEIDAYVITVKEARKLGLSDQEISNYLQVEWITPEEHRRLAARLKVKG